MFRRIWAVMQKEFIQVWRDQRTLRIQLLLPVLQLFLFGYAITMNVSHIPTVVADQSLDAASRAYLLALSNSGYFAIVETAADQAAVVRAVDAGRAQVGVVIPPDFAVQVARGAGRALILVDGSDLFVSQTAYNAASAIAQAHAITLAEARLERSGRWREGQALLPLTMQVRILYNPDLKDLWFLIPGIIALLLQTQTTTFTAASVVREREVGTMEQLLVTPIRAGELLVGKIAPHMIIAMVNMLTVLALGVFWFGVPFRGDFWLFSLLALLYVFSGLGVGLLISTVSQTQRQAQQLVAMIMVLGLLLSGFIFPRSAMPAAIRPVGNLFPLTYFLPIARGILSKGIGVEHLRGEVLALAAYVVVVMTLAVAAFRSKLD